MDLLDLAILALRLALVVCLYLFIALVMRSSLQALRPPASRRATEIELIVVDPGGSSLAPGQAIRLTGPVVVGRTARADIVLGDPAVSAQHARVIPTADGWLVRDLGSTNGTLLNNARVANQAQLANGDELVLGGVRLRVNARSTA